MLTIKGNNMNTAKKNTDAAPQCSVDYAFQRIGGKHKGRLIWHLQHGPVRYGQLRRLIEGVSPKMLTQALRELEEDGLVTRRIFVEVPPRVEYALTAAGALLLPFIELLKEWGEQHMLATGIPSVHETTPTAGR